MRGEGAALYSKVKIGETTILGAGSWGTALAWLWGKDGRQVSLWGHDGDRAARMREMREAATISGAQITWIGACNVQSH